MNKIIYILLCVTTFFCCTEAKKTRAFFPVMADSVLFLEGNYWFYIDSISHSSISGISAFRCSISVPGINFEGYAYADSSVLHIRELDEPDFLRFQFKTDSDTSLFEGQDFFISPYKKEIRKNDKVYYYLVKIRKTNVVTYDINYTNQSIWVISEKYGLIDIAWGVQIKDKNCFDVYMKLNSSDSLTFCRE